MRARSAVVLTTLLLCPVTLPLPALAQGPSQGSPSRPQTRPSPQQRPSSGGNPSGRPGQNPGGRPQIQPPRPTPGNGGNRPTPGRPTPGRPGPDRPNPGRPTPGRPTPGRPNPSRPHPGPNRPPQWGRPPQIRPSYSFRPRDRDYLRRHYLRNLAYINLARRPVFTIGGYFPYGDIGYLTPLPSDLYGYLPPPPPGYQMGYFDGYVVVYDPLTYFIANLVDLLQ